MTAIEFINIIMPEHDRTSCSDENLVNGFYSRNGKTFHSRCLRCTYLEIASGKPLPADFDASEI